MPRKSRTTRQKEIIQKTIDLTKTFFTAEDLFNKTIKIDRTVSIATIYRYLKNLRQHNLIYHYICEGKYIYSKENKSHCHFVCEQTGKIIHFDIDSLDFLKDKIPGSITSFQIEVKGSCIECSEH
jgi:Fe2+ or Zn2+ uptake regulation protein